MDFKELKSFVVLSDQLNFGRAAQLLNLTQPGLSKQIRILESEIGTKLFIRSKHGTRLTATGELLLQEARSIIRDMGLFLEKGKRAAKSEVGKLEIAFGYSTFNLIPRAIAEFRQTHPGVTFELTDMSTAEQVAALKSGKIKIGFLRLPVDSYFQQQPLIKDKLVVILPDGNELRRLESIKQLKDNPWVMLSSSLAPGFHHHVLSLCAKHGFSPRIVQESTEFPTVVALVAAGLGISVVPHSLMRVSFEGVRVCEIKDKEAEWMVGAAWLKDMDSKLIRNFLHLVKTLALPHK